MIQLGDRARDKITGFEGIVMCKREFLFTTTDYEIRSEGLKPDGAMGDSYYFDEQRIEVLKEKVQIVGFQPPPRPPDRRMG